MLRLTRKGLVLRWIIGSNKSSNPEKLRFTIKEQRFQRLVKNLGSVGQPLIHPSTSGMKRRYDDAQDSPCA